MRRSKHQGQRIQNIREWICACNEKTRNPTRIQRAFFVLRAPGEILLVERKQHEIQHALLRAPGGLLLVERTEVLLPIRRARI